jgi:hypothetical protein
VSLPVLSCTSPTTVSAFPLTDCDTISHTTAILLLFCAEEEGALGKDDSSHGLIEPPQKPAQREHSDQKKEVVFNVVQGYAAPEPTTGKCFRFCCPVATILSLTLYG